MTSPNPSYTNPAGETGGSVSLTGSLPAGTNNIGDVDLASQIAGEDLVNDVIKVEERFTSTYISTATTTVVKSGAGFLHAITVSETAAGTITIYDNTAASGTIIGVFKASVVEQTFFFNRTFGTGLTVVTAAASKVTVTYR